MQGLGGGGTGGGGNPRLGKSLDQWRELRLFGRQNEMTPQEVYDEHDKNNPLDFENGTSADGRARWELATRTQALENQANWVKVKDVVKTHRQMRKQWRREHKQLAKNLKNGVYNQYEDSFDSEETNPPQTAYPSEQDLSKRLGDSFSKWVQINLIDKFDYKVTGDEAGMRQIKDVLNSLDVSKIDDDIDAMNYPAGHPHNRYYSYDLGYWATQSDKVGEPFFIGYRFTPAFSENDPYGHVRNPGINEVIKINTTTGNQLWFVIDIQIVFFL